MEGWLRSGQQTRPMQCWKICLPSPPSQNSWNVSRDLWQPRSGEDSTYPTACPQMTPGMTADKYMVKFKMLAVRISFNKTALEDAFIQGLPQSILFNVYENPAGHSAR